MREEIKETCTETLIMYCGELVGIASREGDNVASVRKAILGLLSFLDGQTEKPLPNYPNYFRLCILRASADDVIRYDPLDFDIDTIADRI